MANPLKNLCYSVANKREAKTKTRDVKRYTVLATEAAMNAAIASSESDEEPEPAPQPRSSKLGFISRLLNVKAKNSDDEDSAYELADIKKKGEGSSRDGDGKGLTNRKKKRWMVLYDNTDQPKKHPGWAKIRPAPDIPVKKVDDVEVQAEASTSLIDKPVVQLESQEGILKEFDPLWPKEDENEAESSFDLAEAKVPTKPPRNKTGKEPITKQPELKMATIDALDDNEGPILEQASEKQEKEEGNLLVKANVTYEALEGAVARPVIHDNACNVKEGEVRIVSSGGKAFGAVFFDLSRAAGVELQPVFNITHRVPLNRATEREDEVFPESSEDKKSNGVKKDMPNANLEPYDVVEEQEVRQYQPTEEEEKRNNDIISQFFAEKDRTLSEGDIAMYANNIQISKIEVYAEDIKRYHEKLKYLKEPIDHDEIYTAVETALKLIEKLTKKRDQKRRLRFLPELFEKCLKSKAKREAEAKKNKADKKKKNSRPKMWLVYNIYGKEKIIICTPGDFYDAE